MKTKRHAELWETIVYWFFALVVLGVVLWTLWDPWPGCWGEVFFRGVVSLLVTQWWASHRRFVWAKEFYVNTP